ncbi:hypothetical protein CHGG_00150 [Chaetomium globosum CBS 148.51]|uniref:Uncharacterized protein n=1 Tax=Chaetomium globosum (strain ATCC 6205 / CBS 148.51 / DSM 1962 / NBRC 6347 / NRRL 1970) TaxID=306901 RepID=Q2HI04_CHAGB|nr:uncharacterized protein CHGG_00150 [Chaetomium globosum CBS 148.51]EAQ91915.1 hypothetical protein CHGG_00150 [Chaetomium globosum CBS 148.51]
MPSEKLHHRAMSMFRRKADSMQILNAAVPFRVSPSCQEQVHGVEAAVLRCRFESCTAGALAPASVEVGATSDEALDQTDVPFSRGQLYRNYIRTDGGGEGSITIRSSYGVYVDMASEQGLDDIHASSADCDAEWCIIAPIIPVHVDSTPRVNIFTALEYSLDEAKWQLSIDGSTQGETVGLISRL